MIAYDYTFVLLVVSAILVAGLFLMILKIKNKTQIHYAFLSILVLIFAWCFGHILEVVSINAYGYTVMAYVYVYHLGVCYVPLAIYFTGLFFVKTSLKLKFKHYILIAFPTLSYIVLLTNHLHGLFFVNYSIFNVSVEFGPYFLVHTIGSYIFIITGLYYLLSFSIKNSGFFSRQSTLIILGAMVPLIINIFATLKTFVLPAYATPISFSFSIMCFSFAILKFDFLNIVPIALQRIVDLISDSYVIINKETEIIDYNRTFIETFGEAVKVVRKDRFFETLANKINMMIDRVKMIDANTKAITERKTVTYEDHITGTGMDMYFIIEITPVFSGETYLGTIILFKDITQNKKDLQTIRKNNTILMEQERLASLGQLIGGIAHNLRTPIMSIAGGLEAMFDLAVEYEESVSDPEVTVSDHHEIAAEMKTWINKIKPHCSYMSEIITTVKDQAVHLNESPTSNFTLGELLKRVQILMKHELSIYHCDISIEALVDMETSFKGEANTLVQIIDNIIVNAIHSYGDKSGVIDMTIRQIDDQILFSIRDYGSGIPEDIQKKLFHEMLTTKGKFGTGLGLYMSYSTIRGRFDGDLWFESKPSEGSTFYISIPYMSLKQLTHS